MDRAIASGVAESSVELSVVIPVYNCGDCLRALHARLTEALRAITDSYELIFVDDRSPDDAWAVLREIAAGDEAVELYRLSRNFGQHFATTAGFSASRGRWVAVLDCDLQDRPEDLERLYRKALEGFDIVFSRRSSRSQSLFRRIAARAYFRLRNVLLRLDMDTELGSMFVLSRKAVDSFLQVRDRDRQLGIVLAWLGYETATVEIAHDERYAGRSSYTLGRLLAQAVDGLVFQTTVLLRWIVYVGFCVAVLGAGLAAALVALYFFGHPPSGWTSLAVLLLVLSGFVLIALGVAALYVGKIFDQVKDRPLYIVDEHVAAGQRSLDETAAASVHEARW